MKLGDCVKILSNCSNYGTSSDYPVGTIGYIVLIRSRYEGTPNHYRQYKIGLTPEIQTFNDCNHLYSEHDLEVLELLSDSRPSAY